MVCADLVDKHNTILMANHGVVAWSHNNVEDAYFKMETVEHFAKIALVTHLLGSQQQLSEQELEKLVAARSKYQGPKSAAPMPLATRAAL